MGEYELIMCIVNNGYAEDVMASARACGAKGGTVLNARGTAKEEAEKFFNIAIHPEKEIVMIIVNADLKDAILHAIYKEVGLNTLGQGIAFSIPVTDVVGLTSVATLNKEVEKAKVPNGSNGDSSK